MIQYPIFCLRKKPYNIKIDTTTIKIKRQAHSHYETVDDRTLGGDYFMRLLQMEHRIRFDFTCSNLQEIILSDCRWGIDSSAKIHELPSYNKIRSQTRKIVRAYKNSIWLHRISYPFKIKTQENLKGSVEGKFVDIIKIEDRWFIKRFIDEIN